MLPEGSIAVSNVWKRFRADRKGALMKDQLRRLRARMRGRDPGWTWALRDINFELEPGHSLGIVGANGSGKTTLLRVLSGVMYPYSGKVEVSGRVGALIEVRAGLHPDLTGRENIFVYGTLLGLTRKAVAKRFDEIVEFAEIEAAVDRQMKHFSSGMQMRLGFAIAAFLEPALLIVDEILAVGDAAFQQRCLDRMRAVLSQGTTLLFVSHDLATVEATCDRTIWLHSGAIQADGKTSEVLGAYRRQVEEFAEFTSPRGGDFQILEAGVTSPNGGWPRTQEPVDIRVVVRKNAAGGDGTAQVVVGVTEGTANPIFALRHGVDVSSGTTEVRCHIPRLPLPRGRYFIWAAVWRTGRDVLPWHPVAKFEVEGPDLPQVFHSIVRLSPIHVDAEWMAAPANGHRAQPVSAIEPGDRSGA
ncbi:MAG: polysaccharide ABC transporter ATP-binding protein [Actinomycetota bacterium]